MNAPNTPRTFKSGGSSLVRDAKSGRILPLKGYGSLKGEFKVKPGVDLTKPIAAQTLRGSGKRG